MRSGSRGEATVPAAMDSRREISTAWRTLNKSKTALRHIENRLEAVAGTGVVLDTLMNMEKTSARASNRERRGVGDGTASKPRPRSRRSPDKTSRSPLHNSVAENSSNRPGERAPPHGSHRDTAPASRGADPGNFLSQLVYERDVHPLHRSGMDSVSSSALDATTVHYLNDSPHLEVSPPQATPGSEVRPVVLLDDGQTGATHSSAASSPSSASVRLEKLRQHQADGKLEKLRERIRRQREQLQQAADRERLLGYLEQPLSTGASQGPGSTQPTTTFRKVAPAPPAPIYKGFNTSETKIRTSDGKVWGEEEFQKLSREIYQDTTHHLAERVIHRPPQKDRLQEKKMSKPVRKIHRSASVPSSETKPVISTSSWREGQKLVNMILGSASRLPREPRTQSAERDRQTSSDHKVEMICHSGASSSGRVKSLHRMPAASAPSTPAGGDKKRIPAAAETSRRICNGDGGPVVQQPSQPVKTYRGRRAGAARSSRPAGDDVDKGTVAEKPATPAGGDECRSPSRDHLSANIRGILDDLELEGVADEPGETNVCRRNLVRSSQAPPRLSRSVSPAKTRPENIEPPAPRKRHYDTDTVRRYMARQQEDRKRKQVEQRKSQREEAQRRSQRLQELYRKQREGVARVTAPPTNPVQTRLQETYTKQFLEHTLQQSRPVYQPSGESDKENKGLEALSSSTSELSVSELRPPLLSRAGLGLGSFSSSWLQAEQQSPVAPSDAQLLGLQLEDVGTVDIHADVASLREPAADLHGDLQLSRMERVEALKAQAATLSSRVESEARRLARTSVTPNPSTGLPGSSDVLWAKLSPPERECPAGVPGLGIHRLLRAGHSAFGGDSAQLPGVGNLSSFLTQDRRETMAKPHPDPTGPSLPPAQWAEPADSSGGSISEGPLTDGSLSEDKDAQDRPSATDAADYCALRYSHAHNPVTEFQREAEKFAPYRSAAALQDSRPPWDELAKGSTHSVISIFAKNIHDYSKDLDEVRVTPLHAALSAGSSVIGTAYEDDFISSRSTSQSASKRAVNSLSNGHSGGADEKRERSTRHSHSSTASPLSSPLSTRSSHSTSRRERSLERTLVEGQMNASIVSDQQWNCLRKRDSENSSASVSHRATDTESTPGGATAPSVHSMASEDQTFPRSPAVSPVSLPSALAHSITAGSSSSSPSGAKDTGPAPNSAPDVGPAPWSSSPMHFAPGVLQQRMSAELSYLSAVEESVRQLGEVERVRAVSLAQQESVSLAQILKAQQHRQERELHLLKVKAEQEALEAQRLQVHAREERIARLTELPPAHLRSAPPVTPPYSQHRPPRPQTDSGADGVSARRSPSPSPSAKEEDGAAGSSDCRGKSSSSVEEEARTAIDDSLHTDSVHSLLEDRGDTTSVATEYSVRFEESLTEDELEKSFRSLLPSEAHWRDSVEHGHSPLPQSDEERSHSKNSSQLSTKDGSVTFSGGQDSFSKFTMEMVRQYMQEEEVRAQHQRSLLRLRHRALTENTKAELAWLEHQKRRLRDKGEDDKMPPLRKRQRGLILRLQQEQAEIRRLQEVSRAARRERQLLLKQQEEIERMQHSTLRMKQRLRTTHTSPKSPVSGEIEELDPPSVAMTDVETRSPSPISVSGSETSSIMQKLKKMRYHMDERFLTKREQQLVHRRLQAEELLAWRKRLDAEEVVVQQMELQALVAWEPKPTPAGVEKEQSTPSLQDRAGPGTSIRQDTAIGKGSEEDESSPVMSVSSVHTAPWVSSSDVPVSKHHVPARTHDPLESDTTHSNWANCTVSSSSNLSSHGSSRISELQPSAPTSETASDQSDVEGRVLALKEELRQRKAEVQQLKKEQKQRQKERLKAQEASLLKQLESYNNFIQKTKAELRMADMPAAKPQIKTPSRDEPRVKAPQTSRSEADRNLGPVSHVETEQTAHTEWPAESGELTPAASWEDVVSSEEEPSTVTPTPVLGSPERGSGGLLTPEPQSSTPPHNVHSQADISEKSPSSASVSSERSEVIEELDCLKSEGSSDGQDRSAFVLLSQPLLQVPRGAAGATSPERAPPGRRQPEASDSVNGEEQRGSSSLILSTDEPRLPLRHGPDLSPRRDSDAHAETPSAHAETPSAHGYNDDFESFKEDDRSSDLESPSAAQSRQKSSNKEEVDKEFSVQSGIGDGTGTGCFHSLLAVESQAKPSKEDTSHDDAAPPNGLSALPSGEGFPEALPDGMVSYCFADGALVNNIHPGTLRFKEQTSFSRGFWPGVELDRSEGTSDGVCDGMVYKCKEGPDETSSHLPEKVDGCATNTEEADSLFDDQSYKMLEKHKSETQQSTLQNEKPDPNAQSEQRESHDGPAELHTNLPRPGNDNLVKSSLDTDIFRSNIMDSNQGNITVPDTRNEDIVLMFERFDQEKETNVQKWEEEQTVNILELLDGSEESGAVDIQKDSSCLCEKTNEVDGAERRPQALSTLADRILDSFMCDTVKQFQQIKKIKEEKITAANQQKDFGEETIGGKTKLRTDLCVFFNKDQEEASSPELCSSTESPVLGPSGQEELAKRLAELELSRELLDALVDEQDWFDEDFGLSSRKEQQKLKQQRPEQEAAVCVSPWRPEQEGVVCVSPQVKTAARPQLPQVKQPEQPAMLVPHSAPEVEKLVSAALQEIWRGCGLSQGRQSVAGVPKPQPSEAFLCENSTTDYLEAQCLRSYKQAVFDLSWEVIQDMFAETPKAEQPQWARPRRVLPTCIHRVNSPGDLSHVQAFVTSKVLKLCSLKKGQSHKSDWQKMLKFGRKKRDRVDHILVQELHEEEALWVSYDEDELFVKMQLADGIFDALLRDTAEVLIHIQEKRFKQAL